MVNNQLISLAASDLAELIAAKEISPVEVVAAYLERIDRLDPQLCAYITVCRDEALKAAQEAENAVLRGDSLGPLHGLPLAVKDQFETAGVLTTGGSTILKDYVPSEDATVVARAKDAGAILLGKLNMTEFAAGAGDQYKHRGTPRNPWNLERDPGSSSSGSGIAIAASLCAISLGEDTGGSIRGPASLNGIVGLRPTWGRVSRHGMLPFSWSLDTGGPMTRTVKDAALVLSAIAGYDPKDPQTSRLPVPDYAQTMNGDLHGLRVGILQEVMDSETAEEEVLQAVNDAAAQLGELGAKVEMVSMPLLEKMGTAAHMISENDGATVHSEWLSERPQDYGANIRRRLLAASLVPSRVLQKAMRIRALLRREWLKLLQSYDVLLSPTSSSVAGEIRYTEGVTTRDEADQMFGGGKSATFCAALAGTPAMSVPCGFNSDNMPIGLHIIGSHFKEAVVLHVGHQYQQSTTWHTKRPPGYSTGTEKVMA